MIDHDCIPCADGPWPLIGAFAAGSLFGAVIAGATVIASFLVFA